MEKTNVMRLLDVAHINYTPHEYDPEIVDGLSVAKALSQNPEAVFKTLVCVNDKKEYLVFDVPVGAELSLKKAAKASGSKSVEMIHLKDLLPLTGYVHGGCSPVGLKKPFPVYIDETAQLFEKVFVSGGKRGFQVEVNPLDLANYCHAQFFDLMQ
jgi:Cys-tRNA(Pro)/Cys-tRNA(Cys) deacylase